MSTGVDQTENMARHAHVIRPQFMAGCCLFDHEAPLVGVVESVVDFFLRVFWMHAVPTLDGGCYSCQHGRLETLARRFRSNRWRARASRNRGQSEQKGPVSPAGVVAG